LGETSTLQNATFLSKWARRAGNSLLATAAELPQQRAPPSQISHEDRQDDDEKVGKTLDFF
jgi:hypothetical protein